MKIYSTQGIELLDIQVDDSSVRYRSIMSDDSLTLKFSHTEPVTAPVGSYVDFEGQRYTLWLPENFKKHNTRNFEYTITLGGWREALKLFKFKDLSAMPYRLKFSLTAKPADFLQLLVDNMNVHSNGWTTGSCIDAVERTLSFNHEYCFDVLARIAQEWSTEFEFQSKKIHLRKVEKFKNAPLALSYGKGNGFKSGVGRANDGDKQPIGRLYVQGGERNVDFSVYGSPSLLLPKGQTLVVDGKTYRTDLHGMYITRDGNDLVAEDSFDASHIYPKRVGTVSEVIVVDAEKNFYDIKDTSIPESLDYAACRIDGEKATIRFESGALAGREFDIEQTDKALTGYDHEERLFKIVPQELDGVVMPGGVFVPAVGDKYAIFNISMPASYILDNSTKTGASWDAMREAVDYFAINEQQKFSFTGELDGIWSKSKWLEIGGKIVPGGHVDFSDEQFLPDGEIIRITAVKDYVNFPYKPEITLSNAPIPGGLGSQLGGLEGGEVVAEDNYKRGQLYTKRRWRDLMETMGMLEDGLLNFDKSINPITVRTMQLIVGDESLQFRFVGSKTIPHAVVHNITFDTETKTLVADAGIIQHMTLGISQISTHKPSDYLYWDMEEYLSPPLDSSKSYYLYAKCSKTAETGIFLLSETAIDLQADSEYYHLLVGILNSEFDGDRSFVTFYGFTEILPGRITTDKIVSNDGKTYFDLVNSIIGGNIRFLSNGAETSLDSWASQLKSDLAGLDNQIGDFEDYINGAFKDGVIDAAEAKAIEKYINTIQAEKASIEATYNKIYVNPLLSGTAKTNLLNSKITYFGDVDALINRINQVIADGKVTTAEKQQVDNEFATYRSSYALFSQRIQEANQAIQSAWGSALQANIDGLDNQIGDFEDYINGAFKDGVISESEAKSIAVYINIIESEKASIEATYNKLFVNPLLSGTAKTNLLNAKVSYLGDVDSLISRINQVIADGKVTASEKQQVDSAFSDYRDSYALFSQRIQEANESIQNKIAGDASEALARANIAKAITDKFGTTIDGGLISTVVMLLRESNSTEDTAGISGIQGILKDYPAFWAGGSYEQALGGTAKTIDRHDGSGHRAGGQMKWSKNGDLDIGNIEVDPGGSLVIRDEDGTSRLIITKDDVTPLEDISSSVQNSTVNNPQLGFTYMLSGGVANYVQDKKMLIMNNNTNLSISTSISISISTSSGFKLSQGRGRVYVYLKRIGFSDKILLGDAVVQVDKLSGEPSSDSSGVIAISKSMLIGTGTYEIAAEVWMEATAGDHHLYTLQGNLGASTMIASFDAANRRTEIGKNGIGIIADAHNHLCIVKEGGVFKVLAKSNGVFDMPGSLLSATVASGGGWSNVWGAKTKTSTGSNVSSAAKNSTGRYTVYHSLGHSRYQVFASAHTANRSHHIVSKGNTSFIIEWRTIGSSPSLTDTAFDVKMVGDNY